MDDIKSNPGNDNQECYNQEYKKRWFATHNLVFIIISFSNNRHY